MSENRDVKFTPMTRIGTSVIHPLKENVAYGRLALPVLSKQLSTGGVELQKRALRTLCEQLYDPLKVSSPAFRWMVPVLAKLANHSDSEIRMLLSECFSTLAITPIGRQEFMDSGLYRICFQLIEDENNATRRNASLALYYASLCPSNCERFVSSGLTDRLLIKLSMESLRTQQNIVKVLEVCYYLSPVLAIKHEVVRQLPTLFHSPCPNVRASACEIVISLSKEEAGRIQVLESGMVPCLIEMCRDSDSGVRAKAAAAIMMVAVYVPAKISFVDFDACQKLLPLLDDDDPEVCANCYETLTVLSEVPKAKDFLLQKMNNLLVNVYHRNEIVKQAARRMIHILTSHSWFRR